MSLQCRVHIRRRLLRYTVSSKVGALVVGKCFELVNPSTVH
jgi:hypothetical protein